MLNANARNCFCLCLILLLGMVSSNVLAKGQTTRVSVATDGGQANDGSGGSSLSADGRYVAFTSEASNLVAGDTNNSSDIFFHDRLTKQTTLVSVATGGGQGNEFSYYPCISADGRYVAFDSYSFNLVAGDINNTDDVFVHDRLTKQTTRVSVSTGGAEANYGAGGVPRISADGRYVVFESFSTNLIAGDTNGSGDVFVHDRLKQQTTRVSVRPHGGQANAQSYPSALSADGRYVGFSSLASNLVAGDTIDTAL